MQYLAMKNEELCLISLQILTIQTPYTTTISWWFKSNDTYSNSTYVYGSVTTDYLALYWWYPV